MQHLSEQEIIRRQKLDEIIIDLNQIFYANSQIQIKIQKDS
jgi:hypothetical protein